MLLALTALLLATVPAVRLTAQGDPGGMNGMNLSSLNAGEIAISWGQPDADPSDYRICWTPADQRCPSWRDENLHDRGNAYPDGSARSYTVTGLPAGSEYKVLMRARFNQDGQSGNPWSGPWATATITVAGQPQPSPTSSATPTPTHTPTPQGTAIPTPTPTATPTPTPTATPTPGRRGGPKNPDAISGLTLTSDTPGELAITWDIPANTPGGYCVSWAKAGESFQSQGNDECNAHPAVPALTVTGLEPGVEYQVRVRARFDQDTSDPRSGPWLQATQTVLRESVAPAPTGLTATVSNGRVILTWDDPGDSDITGYRIFRSFHEDYFVTLRIDTGTADPTYTDPRPTAGQVNVYAIRALTPAGESELSGAVTIRPPGIPHGLTAAVGESAVTLSWSASDDTVVVAYQVLRGPTADDLEILVENTGSTDTSYDDTSPQQPGTVYYAVRARTARWTGKESDPVPVWIPGGDEDDAVADGTILVSNTELPAGGDAATVGGVAVAQSFRTGSSPPGYMLSTVRLEMSEQSGDPNIVVAIHANSGSTHGAKLYDMLSPESLDGNMDIYHAPAGATLEPDTTYWVVIQTDSASSGEARLQLSDDSGSDTRSAPGFDFYRSTVSGARSNPVRAIITGRDIADIPPDVTTQETMTVGHTTYGEVNSYGDRDWYRIMLNGGTKYRFTDMHGFPRDPGLAGIYDASGVEQSIATVTNYTHSLHAIRRHFFTPPTTGTYYVSAGVARHTEVRVTANSRGNVTHPNYGVRVSLADTETTDTNTAATVAVGENYRGNLYFPHDGNDDTDWVRASLVAGQKYQFVLQGHPAVESEITGIYNSGGTAVSGFRAVSSAYRHPVDGGWRGDPGWLSASFRPSMSGDYYIEIHALGGSYYGSTVKGSGVHVSEYIGVDYILHVWSDGQSGMGESSGRDTSDDDVFTTTRLSLDGNKVDGAINNANDEDWLSVWMDQGETYALLLQSPNTDVEIAGVRELPKPHLHLPQPPRQTETGPFGITGCSVHTYTARRDGVHFVTVTGTGAAPYEISAVHLDDTPGKHTNTENDDLDECTEMGYLLPGQSATGYLNRYRDIDRYIVWMRAGEHYSISAIVRSLRWLGLEIVLPDGTVNQTIPGQVGFSFDERWDMVATQSGPHVARVSSASVQRGTYTITFNSHETDANAPVANITGSPEDINEGDNLNYVVGLDRPAPRDITVNLDFIRDYPYPRFTGGITGRTVRIPRNQTSGSLSLDSIDDEVLTMETEYLVMEIAPGTGYRVGSDALHKVGIADGSYVPELDSNNQPTGQTVFDPNDDAITISWPNCGAGEPYIQGGVSLATGTATAQEDAGTITIPVVISNGTAVFDFSLTVLNQEVSATRENDYNAPSGVEFSYENNRDNFIVEIIDDRQLEDTDDLLLIMFLRSSESDRYLFECQYMRVIIEDDDEAQITMEAEQNQVDEGEAIDINISHEHATNTSCIIPFAHYVEVTPTGDTSALVNADPMTISIPSCSDDDGTAVSFATVEDTGVTADRSLTFTVTRIGTSRDFSEIDDRLLLPASGVTVTVAEDDS